MVSRRTVYAAVAIIILAIASSVGTYYLTRPPPPKPYDKVILALGFAPTGAYSWAYVGLDKGYYDDEGIIVTIQSSQGSSDAATKVSTGRVDFADVGLEALIPMISQGAAIKAVGLECQKTQAGIIIDNASGIKVPKDMEGRSFAAVPGAIGLVLFPAFAKNNGIDVNKVKIITISPASLVAVIKARQVDGAIGSIRDASVINVMGEPCFTWCYADYGLPVLGSAIVTSNKLINEKPDVIHRFLRASYKAMAYSISNPQEAVNILIKYVPELKANEELARWQTVILQMDPQIKAGKKGTDFGIMDSSLVEQTNNIVSEGLKISPKVSVQNIYTNDFLK